MLFTVTDGQFYFLDNLILDKINVEIGENDRIGLIGENGSGKTTLLNLLTGEYKLDKGEIQKRKALSYGYLKQNSGLNSDKTVIEEMRECFRPLIKLEERMREIEQIMPSVKTDSAEFRALSNEYSSAKTRFEGLDGYNIDVKIKTVLNGMGFINLYDRNCSTFSGGEKTRLSICKLLLSEPELLILDEPTNHLDFSTLYWLEEYLKTYRGAILTVSHDRFFLDKTVTKIWELEDKTIKTWRGNYTKYKDLKAEWVDSTMKEYEKQQVEIAKMEDYVARNLVRATTAKSAQSRVKKLDSLNRIEKPKTTVKPPVFVFSSEISPTKEVVKAVDLNLKAGEKTLFNNAFFTVFRNEKAAIVGENGTGKSTLLKKILSSYGKFDNDVVFGKNVFISYYDQENLNLNFDNTVINEMWDKFPRSNEYDIRRALGRMLFSDVDLDKKISSLSGGERAKLGFAIMTMKKSNFLILDEPTNHIDLLTREALEKALIEFEGTVLFVSHDRYFLSKVADKIIEISDNAVSEYKCGFDEFNNDKNAQEKSVKEELPEEKKNEKKTVEYKSAKTRSEEVKRKNEIKETEDRISAIETRNKEIDLLLSDPETAKDYAKLKPLLDEQSENNEKLTNLYHLWESLTENV